MPGEQTRRVGCARRVEWRVVRTLQSYFPLTLAPSTGLGQALSHPGEGFFAGSGATGDVLARAKIKHGQHAARGT